MPSPHRVREIARQESGHRRVVALSGAQTLTDNDAGTYFTVTQASEYDITLPTISATRAGWWADFVVATAGSNDIDVVAASADADKIYGVENSDTADHINAADKVTFVASNAKAGDWLHIWTDGTNWYARLTGTADNATASSG